MYLQKYKQRPSTVNLMARRQLHCQTSLIVSSVISDVFKQLRFKQVPTTVIGTFVGYIVWQSTTAAPQVQLQAGQCSHPAELVLRESLTPRCTGTELMPLRDRK